MHDILPIAQHRAGGLRQVPPQQAGARREDVERAIRHGTGQPRCVRQQVHDDVLSAHAVSVTEVRMSPDLRHAAVFVKPLLGVDEAVVLKALRTHTAYFQKEVAGRLKLKYAAKLQLDRKSVV